MNWELVAVASGRLAEAWALRIILAVLLVVLMWRVAHWARVAFDRATARTGVDIGTRLVTGRLVFGSVLILGFVWALGILGLDQASILATFGVFGLALSLAAQDI